MLGISQNIQFKNQYDYRDDQKIPDPVDTITDNKIQLNHNSPSLFLSLFARQDQQDSGSPLTTASLVFTARWSVALMNGALMAPICLAGTATLLPLNSISHLVTGSFFSCIATFAYTLSVHHVTENLSFMPQSKLSCLLAFLTPFSSALYYTAEVEAANLIFIFGTPAVTMGVAMCAFRIVLMTDACVKFPDKVQELQDTFKFAREQRKPMQFLKIGLALYATVGFSLSASDGIFNTAQKFLQAVGIQDAGIQNTIALLFSIFGALGYLPMVLYWTLKGLSIIFPETGTIFDHKHHVVALVFSGLNAIPILGTVPHSSGHAFGQMPYSFFVRASSALLYGFTYAMVVFPAVSEGIYRAFYHEQQDHLLL